MLHPQQCVGTAVVEVVQDHQGVTLLHQPQGGVTADEAGTAGDKEAMPHVDGVLVKAILLEVGESAFDVVC